jgi:hypothetical protein
MSIAVMRSGCHHPYDQIDEVDRSVVGGRRWTGPADGAVGAAMVGLVSAGLGDR